MSRSRPDAIVHDVGSVVRRGVRMAAEGKVITTDGTEIALRVDTICIHGDTPGALELVRAVRSGLERAGVIVARVSGPPG
jgi:5-oxoprolinase (ATP-hydrolysing) subunit A